MLIVYNVYASNSSISHTHHKRIQLAKQHGNNVKKITADYYGRIQYGNAVGDFCRATAKWNNFFFHKFMQQWLMNEFDRKHSQSLKKANVPKKRAR